MNVLQKDEFKPHFVKIYNKQILKTKFNVNMLKVNIFQTL